MLISSRGESALLSLRRHIEACEAKGLAWEYSLSVPDVDTTSTGDEAEFGALKGGNAAEMVRADVVARKMTLHVGNLEVYADTGTAAGILGRNLRVRLDGKRFPCRAIRIEGHVREMVKASIDFFPARASQAQEDD
jgi:hypothetical protein